MCATIEYSFQLSVGLLFARYVRYSFRPPVNCIRYFIYCCCCCLFSFIFHTKTNLHIEPRVERVRANAQNKQRIFWNLFYSLVYALTYTNTNSETESHSPQIGIEKLWIQWKKQKYEATTTTMTKKKKKNWSKTKPHSTLSRYYYTQCDLVVAEATAAHTTE